MLPTLIVNCSSHFGSKRSSPSVALAFATGTLLGYGKIRWDPVEYHGKRVPCLATVERVVQEVRRVHPDIWEFATDNGKLWGS